MKRVLFAMAFSIFLFTGIARAGNIFDISITTTDNETFTGSFTSVTSMIDELQQNNLDSHFTSYTDNTGVSAELNFRGIPIFADYTANSSALRIRIPETGLDITFTGATRNDSQNSFEDWVKSEGSSEMTKLLQALAKNTPYDPIAGNPNSQMATLVTDDFAPAFEPVAEAIAPPAEEPEDKTQQGEAPATKGKGNQIGVGVEASMLDQKGLRSTRYTIPLKYTIVSKADSRKKYVIKVPVSRTEVDGAQAYSLGLGLAVTFPMSDQWTLTPAAGYGLGGSIDLGSAAQLVSGSLTSSYTWPLAAEQQLTMGNMFGYYKTLKFTYGGYSIDPKISNSVLRNGLMWKVPAKYVSANSHWELFVIDTRYYGTDLYIEAYDEIGAAFGFTRKLRLGATYLTASNSKGFSVNFGYKF